MLTLALILAAAATAFLLTGSLALVAAGHRKPRYVGRHRAPF